MFFDKFLVLLYLQKEKMARQHFGRSLIFMAFKLWTAYHEKESGKRAKLLVADLNANHVCYHFYPQIECPD